MAIKVLSQVSEPITTPTITTPTSGIKVIQKATPFGGGGSGGIGERQTTAQAIINKPQTGAGAQFGGTSKTPLQTTIGTLKNVGALAGKGIASFGENVLDTALQIGSSKYNPYYWFNKDKLKGNQAIAQEIIKDNAAQDVLNKIGYTEQKQKTLDENSILKSYGLGGQIVQGAGAMIPTIIAGNVFGTGAGIATTSTSAFGGGVDEATKAGATREQATAYGLLNAAVENATEFITGGIPGVKTKWLSGFDKLAEKGISKISSELLQAATRAGYKVIGEGAEEALATILNPIIKNATYSKGEKVNWEQVANDALSGAILGGILNLPSSVIQLSNGAKVDQVNLQKAKDLSTIVKAEQQPSTITPTIPQTTQGMAQMQPQEQVEQPLTKESYGLNTTNPIIDSLLKKKTRTESVDNYDFKVADIPNGTNYVGKVKDIITDPKLLSLIDENTKNVDIVFIRDNRFSKFDKGRLSTAEEANKNFPDGKTGKPINIDLNNEFKNKPIIIMNADAFQDGTQLFDDMVHEIQHAQRSLKGRDIYGGNETYNESKVEKSANNFASYVINERDKRLSQQPTITPQVTTQQPETTTQETKQRGVFSTTLQNQNIPAEIKSGIKNINQNYIIITDEDALSKAQQKLTDNGADKSLELFKNKFDNNEKLSKYDIAEATLLYNDAFAKGDTQKALDILTSIAVAGTESGQVSQATSILQRATPDGRLLALQKQLNKVNQERNTDLKLDEQDANNIKNSTNQESLDNAVNKAIENISKQIPKTMKEMLREWRYLSMLGNPKTHIRNVVSNLAMKGTSKVKNTLSSVLQDIFLDEQQQTRTLKKSSKEVIDFAKQDAEKQKSRIMGEDKYDMGKTKIQPAKGKLSVFNSNALKAEDWLFSSSAYSQSLANYITAKNIDLNNITTKQLEEARQYAIDQAEEQTFRKASKIANAISQFEKKNIATEILVGSTLPFKTTPINIAKTGIEYSPVGLIKTITKNTYDLKQGKISPSQYIDNLSKGLTGTGITALGYLLAEMGLLTASGSDEDKEKYFQQMQGKQPYSIQIGNKTITLDWLSPTAMPFFMGAEISEMKKNGTSNDKLLNIASGLATIVDPLTEMSMLQGLNKTLKSYKDNALGGVLVNTLENYALQYIPTISGQIARTITPDRKSTTGAGTGITKEFNTFLNKAKAKIPVIANTLEPYTDQFGNKEITRSIAERAFQNFLSPAYIKTTKTDKVYKEIQKLYDKTGETSILPTSSSRYFTQDGKKIYLTPKEYTKFNTIDGQNSLKELSSFFNSQIYKEMSDEERVSAIESFYRASQQIAKERYKK